MFVVHYRSNNSGGSWWLSEENWDALEAGGWVVHWIHPREIDHGIDYSDKGREGYDPHLPDKYGISSHDHSYSCELIPAPKSAEDWLGARAKSCSKKFESGTKADAIAEWERLSGQNASDIGCNCCGTPHSFSFEDEDGEKSYASIDVPESGSLVLP